MGRTGNGVEARLNSIRIKLVHQGVTVRETLTNEAGPLAPTPANLKHAARLAAEIRKRIGLGTFNLAEFFPDSPRAKAAAEQSETLGALLATWQKSKGKLSAATRDQYATAVRFWKRVLGEATPLDALTHKHLAAKIGGYPWPSAKTHNNYLIALRGALALEYRGAKQGANPLAGIENMTAVKKLPDPLSAEERDKILADMRKHYPDQVVAYFLWQFFTGMRPEETIALRWSDVDTQRQTVRVQRVRTFKGSERDGSKTHTVRDVDLLPQALEALKLMKPHTALLRTEREKEEDTSADIFQHPVTGRPWHDERSQRDTYWRPSLKRQGVRWRTAYATRHTFATCALMAGVPPAYIAAQLGHSVKMLLDRYARWIPGGDGGGARALLAAAMGGDSPLKSPQAGNGA
ncbi:Arm DNA-binding domain-containing protein [Hydrogenophaga defluvii]|uniref:Arm DNA-binding domain-containing protein n=1 Tax=Hydrogenophaga defluvii TaxID=249410 RepID=A0ABW2SBV2_9BURK